MQNCVDKGFRCNILGGQVGNCCDGRPVAEGGDGENCHFLDGINYGNMRRDLRAYHRLENRRDNQGRRILINNRDRYRRRAQLNQEGRRLLGQVERRRRDWIQDYLKENCYDCDGFCRNHMGRWAAARNAQAAGPRHTIKKKGTKKRHRRTRGRGRTRGRRKK